MILSKKYRIKWSGVPLLIRTFLIKALLLLILWKGLYLLFLLPGRILDKPLTNFIAHQTVTALNLFSSKSFTAINTTEYNDPGIQVVAIQFHNRDILEIADVCNGLELIVLYIGFILCIPSGISRKLKYSLIGIFAIFLLNITRCCLLSEIAINKPQYLNFSHHYAFNIIVYGCIFFFWLFFTRKLTLSENEKE